MNELRIVTTHPCQCYRKSAKNRDLFQINTQNANTQGRHRDEYQIIHESLYYRLQGGYQHDTFADCKYYAVNQVILLFLAGFFFG
jgi:hypothetical protein